MTDPEKKKIDRSLEDSTKAIDSLRSKMRKKSSRVPKQTLQVENRLSAIQEEMDSMSDKMLAYKLRRIADSKMLESVSSLANETRVEVVAPPPAPSPKSLPVKSQEDAGAPPPEYNSSTFQCKSDLDMCLIDAKSALDKALCYALFIRCTIKG